MNENFKKAMALLLSGRKITGEEFADALGIPPVDKPIASGECQVKAITVDAKGVNYPTSTDFRFKVTSDPRRMEMPAAPQVVADDEMSERELKLLSIAQRFRMADIGPELKAARKELLEFAAAPVQAQEPVALLTLGGIDGDEYGDNDLELVSSKAVEKLQAQLVRGQNPVVLELFAHSAAACSSCYGSGYGVDGAACPCGCRPAPAIAPPVAAGCVDTPEFQRLAELWRYAPAGTREFMAAWDGQIAHINAWGAQQALIAVEEYKKGLAKNG